MMARGDEFRLHLRISDELIARIDDWRRKQPAIPDRSATIRYLLEYACTNLAQKELKKGRH